MTAMVRTRTGRVLVAVWAGLLGMGGLAVVGGSAPSSPDRPLWVSALERAQAGDEVPMVPWQGSSLAAPLASSIGVAPATAAFPEPARWTESLDSKPSRDAGGHPVRVVATAAASAGSSAEVEVFDRTVAKRLGVSGFVFTVRPSAKASVSVSVDYSGFVDAYGAAYADRLRVVALPGCALAEGPNPGCAATGTPLPTRNDRAAKSLAVDVTDLSAPTAFAVVSGVGGEEGTFAASPLSLSSGWQVAPGSGAFTYTYPIDVPAPAGGSAPTVALSYSSSAVDGLTLARNSQASPTGVGWSDFANAFIERQYEPCLKRPIVTTDLCWMTDNATISLAGVSGPLIPVNAAHTEWRAQSDPGWTIERLTGAPYTTIHDGQYWKVTGPDGTQYFFGYGHMPGRTTNSTLAVRVVADNTAEPCRAAGDQVGACDQGWRWYLDRVVDPDGNVQSLVYEREDNWYHSALGALGGQPMTAYHRGALLKEIDYGGRDWDPDNYAARVVFDLQWRCGFLVAECPAPAQGAGGFPDVPTDLICGATSACAINTPSFFTARRYAAVRTEVRVGAAWKPVAQHNIIHSFGDGQNGVEHKLQIAELQHAGIAFGKLGAYPSTRFDYVFNDNRADHNGDIAKAMRHNRISRITNPFGGTVSVSYTRNRACSTTYDPSPRWDLNTMDCFPQSIKDDAHLLTGVFNKYLVRQVTESPGAGSPDIVTTYAYEGSPAWAFDTSAFSRDEDEAGWSVWRGYDTVLVTKGTAKTRIRVFRGWDGDPMLVQDGNNLVPLGRRDVSVSELGRPSVSYVDYPGLAGRVVEEQQLGILDGRADQVVTSRRHTYERRVTFDAPADFRFDPEWSALSTTTERVAISPDVFRERRSKTTYNAHFQPATTLEEGWLDTPDDERCSITTYADNPSAGMFGYPAENRRVAGQCDSTRVLSTSQTFYDGATTLGAAPSRGNPTRQRTLIDGSRWAETTTDYDTLGRPVRATDAKGGATTTVYTVTAGAPATQIPIATAVTNALGQQVWTEFHPEFGIPKREVDINGNTTDLSYDEFGRLTAVWLPTEPLTDAEPTPEPSWKFSYDIANRAVRSQRLVSNDRTGAGVVFEDGWVIYDGFWRERQSQGVSSTPGKALVTETTYEDRGLVRDETVEQAVAGTPGHYLDAGTSWQNRTRHAYDELGREVRQEWLRGSSVAGATLTSYGADTVTITGPDGRQVRERIDALGRTSTVAEFDGQSWVASTYGYDLADRLTSVTDPAGNRITYTYNLAGWRTGQQDPDRGTASFGYDDAGNRTSVRDAAGNQIHTSYDVLGRQVERRAGSPTGDLLAAWQYDTAPGGKGKLHRESTHTESGDWVTTTTAYDAKGRPTGSAITVPGVPGLAGTYAVAQTYDRADRVTALTYPAIGALPRETVTTAYDTLGLPTRMAGLEEYVWGAAYDDRGRLRSAGFGPRTSGATWLAQNWTYDVDQRVAGSQTVVGTSVVADHALVFDPAGNLTEKLTRQNGLSWRECFGYDTRSRLTSAHTVAATNGCTGGTPGTGDQPYAHSYGYSADGRLTDRVENGVRTAYTYPPAGGSHPHAPSRVGGTSYTWDARGNLATRTGESYSWDVQGLLRSVTNAGGTTSFVYDPSGQRLLRRAPNGDNTIYVAGHEVTANTAGTVLSTVRTYTFEGHLVATRTGGGTEYLITDPAGSVELAIRPGQTTPSALRAYEPYGQVRAQTGDPATDRGFLGQIEDPSTSLSYLNNRYYDPEASVFISTDPLFDTGKVKSLNPYSYSTNNPATFADPGGLQSAYSFGVESENAQLREQNRALIDHIGRLNSHIEGLQDIVREQQKVINKLVSYVHALEAEIARQASVIRQLQARVTYLERVVVSQQREIGRLRSVVARQQRIIRYQAGVIRYQAGVIGYYKGIVNVLGFRLWGGTPQYAWVMDSIYSFRGIPAGAFNYDHITRLQATVAVQRTVIGHLSGDVADLTVDLDNMTSYRSSWKGLALARGNEIDDLNDRIDSLEESLDADIAARAEFQHATDPSTMNLKEQMCFYWTGSATWHQGILKSLVMEAAQWTDLAAGISNVCWLTGQ
jgi:RHS repeat-associated protein